MNQRNERKAVPVHLLTGFLGSGKTTLLARAIEYCNDNGLKAAVIMNELGEVNLDGQVLGEGVPMAEMLGGCICCTIRADLGMQIYNLTVEHKPDIIFIESTGAAHPVEILDGITEAAMYARIELLSVVTVVDGHELLKRSRESKGQTFKLMKEQIRCATSLLLNKSDKLEPEELVEAQQLLRELNGYAPITPTVRSVTEDWDWLSNRETVRLHDHQRVSGEGASVPDEPSRHKHEHKHPDGKHESHEHVMVLTHYMNGPVHSEAFEAFLQQLPENVYRAKGIVTFTDTASRFLFQFAYRESDYLRITPQGNVADVAVFIGEHFDKERLLRQLLELEQAAKLSPQ